MDKTFRWCERMNRFAVPLLALTASIIAILFHSYINDAFLRFIYLLFGCFYLPWSVYLFWLEITSRKPSLRLDKENDKNGNKT